jgi:hypothetical protein
MSKRVKRVVFLVSFLVVSLSLPGPALGQTAAGRIIGTVSDPQGAAVANAKVTVTNTAIGAQWTTTTGPDGAYQVLDLPIGTYTVSVEREGFAKAVTAVQTLEINQSLRVDVQLKLGSTRDVVEVSAEAAQVETVNPTIGGTVTGAPIQNLPLNGRDALDLALTQPGVTPALGATLPPEAAGVVSGKFSVAGGRDNSVTYLLDGGNNTSVTYGSPVVDPNPDTVAEFRILDNNYTAEYGRSAGGVVSMVTKSGTNSWHGTAYDYLRNDALDANTFFNKAFASPGFPALPRPVLKRNQFGGTFGGPVKKDKMFFFFGYQGQREHRVMVGDLQTVFTPAELQGDFSNSPYAASVASFLEANPYFQPNAALAAQGIIDPTTIDPVAQAYISHNLIPVTASGLLVPNGLRTTNNDEYIGKFDWNATAKDHVSLTLSKFHNPLQYPFLTGGFAPNISGFPGNSKFDNYFGTVSWVRTMSATMLNEARITAQHDNNWLNHPAVQLAGPADLGMNITPDQTTGPPQINLVNSGPEIGFNLNGPANYADTTYLYTDTLTWNRGRHTWKAGVTFGAVENNAYFAFAVDGQFFFYGSNTGSDLADFLIGAPEFYDQYPKGFSAIRSKQYSGFLQDEWKVSPRLMLTLGVRYEYSTPKSDPKNRNYMIIPGVQSVKFPNAPLGLVFPGDPGAPSHGVNFPDRNDWAPRIGFAWDVSGKGKTSIRGGGGIFYDVLLAQDNQYQNGTPPFFSAAALPLPPAINGQNTSLSDPYTTVCGFDCNPFPSKPLTPSTDFIASFFVPYFGASSVIIDRHLRTPYIYQYNLSVQQQLATGLAAEVGYVGSSSHKLVATEDSDPYILGTMTRIYNQLPGTQTMCPFPDPNCPYSAVTATFGNFSNATYNGLLASLTKRAGDWHGIGSTFFTLSYTWSHIIDDADGFARNSNSVSYYNHHAFRAPGDSDIRHRLVFSGGWELPFAHLWSDGPKRLTSGWSLYPILFMQTGFPMDVTGGLVMDYFSPGPSQDGDLYLVRADWAGGAPHSLDPHKYQTITLSDGTQVTGHFAFDPFGLTSACSQRTCSAPTYGTLPRNFFRGPGRTNMDLSLEKRTSLAEHVELTFRAEFFNLFNHTQWKSPNISTPFGSQQLGQITQTYDPRIGQLALRLSF